MDFKPLNAEAVDNYISGCAPLIRDKQYNSLASLTVVFLTTHGFISETSRIAMVREVLTQSDGMCVEQQQSGVRRTLFLLSHCLRGEFNQDAVLDAIVELSIYLRLNCFHVAHKLQGVKIDQEAIASVIEAYKETTPELIEEP